MLGALLISWTIRLSLICYGLVLAGELTGLGRGRRERAARWLWTCGCLLFVAHVLSAFHFYHHWSHAHVLRHTAEQTEALIGWAFGEGVYFSYGFLLLWIADVVWWWLHRVSYGERNAVLHWCVHAYLFFIAFNGAIVFEAGVTRWFGVPVCVVLLVLLVRKQFRGAAFSPATESAG